MAIGGKRGVSTVIGMAIFLIIFAMAVSYTFVWTQYFSDYGAAVKGQIEFNQLRNSESLEVAVFKNGSDTLLNVTNPTGNVIVVTQVWSNHYNITGEWGIPPFGYATINATPIQGQNGEFKVVTSRGNVFSGAYAPPGSPMEGRWLIKWYNSTGPIGVGYLDELNINMRWYKGSTGMVGFNASTKFVALNQTAIVLVKVPLVSSVELNITAAGEEKVKPNIMYITNLTVGKTYDMEIRMRTYDTVDMDLSLIFIGMDFARD
ncbi:MAG: hypothetical protein QHG94_00500 [Candidatus Methanosuratincola sp.]|nr:hypothetical protein [Candidatus Methanosuratincola sp.]